MHFCLCVSAGSRSQIFRALEKEVSRRGAHIKPHSLASRCPFLISAFERRGQMHTTSYVVLNNTNSGLILYDPLLDYFWTLHASKTRRRQLGKRGAWLFVRVLLCDSFFGLFIGQFCTPVGRGAVKRRTGLAAPCVS